MGDVSRKQGNGNSVSIWRRAFLPVGVCLDWGGWECAWRGQAGARSFGVAQGNGGRGGMMQDEVRGKAGAGFYSERDGMAWEVLSEERKRFGCCAENVLYVNVGY